MEGNEERLNESVIQTIDISSNELANASIKTIVQREWRLIVFGIFLCVFFAYYLYQSLSFLKCDVQVDTYDDNRCDLFFIGTTISYAKVQTSFPLFCIRF